MRPFIKLSCVLVCVTTLRVIESRSDVLAGLNAMLEENGVTSVRKSETKSEVTINRKRYEIYVYEPTGDVNGNYCFNTATKFYTAVNCEIAEWIRDRFFNEIVFFPLLYQKDFASYNASSEHVRLTLAELDDVVKLAERSINVLLGVTDAHLREYDSSYDTDVLRTLMSFVFEVNHWKIQNSRLRLHKHPDKHVLRVVLELLNSIQRFIFFNCKPFFHHDNRQFYGFTTNEVAEDIRTFFDGIKPLNFETRRSCDVNEMTMRHAISWRFGQILWRTENGWATVQQVMQTIDHANDLDAAHWYQTNMFDTVTCLLFTKILSHLTSERYVSKRILNELKSIVHTSSLSDLRGVPSDLKRCFSFLTENSELEYANSVAFVKTATNYVKSLSHVNTAIDPSSVTGATVGFEGVRYELNDLPISTLDEFVVYLKRILVEFQCFVRLFRFLRDDHDGAYAAPLAEKTKNRKLFQQKFEAASPEQPARPDTKIDGLAADKALKKQCRYFADLYNYCFETQILLNMAHSRDGEPDAKSVYLSRVVNNMAEVRTFLTVLFDGHFRRPRQLLVLYRALPLLELLDDHPELTADRDSARRLIYTLMVEFNVFGLEYCAPPEHNFSFFNNIDFDTTGLRSERLSDFSRDALKNNDAAGTSRGGCKYSSVRRALFAEFENAYGGFEQYDGAVRLNWKGQKMSIGDIQRAVARAVIDPSAVYGMYDQFFKFSLASVCYEAYRACGRDDVASYAFRFGSWPKKFANTFGEIANSVTAFTAECCSGGGGGNEKRARNVWRDRFISEFQKIGVSLDLSEPDDASSNVSSARSKIDRIFDFADTVGRNYSNNCVYGGD